MIDHCDCGRCTPPAESDPDTKFLQDCLAHRSTLEVYFKQKEVDPDITVIEMLARKTKEFYHLARLLAPIHGEEDDLVWKRGFPIDVVLEEAAFPYEHDGHEIGARIRQRAKEVRVFLDRHPYLYHPTNQFFLENEMIDEL